MRYCIRIIVLITFSLDSNAWQPVTIFHYDRWVTAYIPQSHEENEACLVSSIMSYTFFDQGALTTAYVFPDMQSLEYGCSSNVRRSEYDRNLQALSSGLASLSLSGTQQLFRSANQLELFPVRRVAKHCASFAFKNVCYRERCQYEHIPKNELKDKVVCFQHVLGHCKKRKCLYYHLTDSQASQAMQAKKDGMNIPVIFCTEDHDSDQDKANCPYLHFEANLKD